MADIRGKNPSGNWRDLKASNADILLVTGKIVNSRSTVTLVAASDYASGDVLSDSTSAGTARRFRNVVDRDSGGGVIVMAHAMCSATGLTPRITSYFFEAIPTSNLNDNAANTALLEADLPNYLGKIDFTGLGDLGGYSEAIVTTSTAGNLPIAFGLESGRDIYSIDVTRDAITGEVANMKLTITLAILQS